MNIIHVEDEPWDSGIAHYALTLAEAQARSGHHVHFWSLRDSPVLHEAQNRNLHVYPLTNGLLKWTQLSAFKKAMEEARPDVVNSHTGSAQALVGMILPPGVAHVRTRGDARPPKSTPLTRLSLRSTAAFIAANSRIQSQLRVTFPGMTVDCIPQGIFAPPTESPLPSSATLGLIARLDPVKGHEVMIEAATKVISLIPETTFLCAGSGRLHQSLTDLIAKYSLNEHIRLLGHQPNKWAFLASCRIGLITSIASEAVSRAALEWMASARPIIASDVGGLSDLVEHNVTGLLIKPNDARALADAIMSMLENPLRTQEMGRAARERWEKLFSIQPFMEQTQKSYEKAIHHISRR
jgi:glycosyltransferase involved in cell wall biosynthesis